MNNLMHLSCTKWVKALCLLVWLSQTSAAQRLTLFSKLHRQRTTLAATLACDETPYRLVHEDNFDSLNTATWLLHYPYPPPYDRIHADNNGERQLFLAENVQFKNGICYLTARREPREYLGQTYQHTSGMLHSTTAFQFNYGKFELRCKLPRGNGFWPAFWLWGISGEIDIFEITGNEPTLQHTNIHRAIDTPTGKSRSRQFHVPIRIPNSADDFHTYTVEWSPTEIIWYTDGQRIRAMSRFWNRWGAPRFCPYTAGSTYIENLMLPVTDEPLNIIINLSIADDKNGWTPAPTPDVVFPQSMELDYLRVYQKIKP